MRRRHGAALPAPRSRVRGSGPVAFERARTNVRSPPSIIMRLQRRRALSLNVAELEARTLLAVTGVWLGQDGHDLVGLSPDGKPDDIQDLHFAIAGLAAGQAVA